MKKILLLIAAAVLSSVSLLAAAPPEAPKPDSRVEEVTIKSSILGVEKTYCVYLPSGYDRNPDRHYPILYLLHGASGWYGTWTKSYNMKTITDWRIASGFSVPMIIVMPDAAGTGERNTGPHMGYFNFSDWRYEDFFFQEFIPEVESRYRVIGDRAHRAIAGLSMGGDGTICYAMTHPEMFSSACPLSARAEFLPTGYDRPLYAEYLEVCKKYNWVKILRESSPEDQEKIKKVRWYIDCGDDDYLFEGNAHLYLLMRELRFPCAQYRVREGTHQQEYWRTALPDVLTFVSIGFSTASAEHR